MDVLSLFYSPAMLRVDEDSLALHLEVSLATAEPALVTSIRCGDAVARRRATAELARHLAMRLRCYDILADESAARSDTLPLFPDA
jgi:DNA-binding phage protein